MKTSVCISAAVLLALLGSHGDASAAAPGSGTGVAADTAAAARNAPESSATVELRFDEIARHGERQLRWLTLDDSRCPTGTTCVWAGQVAVTVELAGAGLGPVEVSLLASPRSPPESAFALGCELRVLDVSPHPKEGREPARSDYSLRLAIACP